MVRAGGRVESQTLLCLPRCLSVSPPSSVTSSCPSRVVCQCVASQIDMNVLSSFSMGNRTLTRLTDLTVKSRCGVICVRSRPAPAEHDPEGGNVDAGCRSFQLRWHYHDPLQPVLFGFECTVYGGCLFCLLLMGFEWWRGASESK